MSKHNQTACFGSGPHARAGTVEKPQETTIDPEINTKLIQTHHIIQGLMQCKQECELHKNVCNIICNLFGKARLAIHTSGGFTAGCVM